MKVATLSLIATCGLALVAVSGCASRGAEAPMTNQGETMHFNIIDKNDDKYITTEELPTDHALLRDFTHCDLNGDGKISEYEFGEYIERM